MTTRINLIVLAVSLSFAGCDKTDIIKTPSSGKDAVSFSSVTLPQHGDVIAVTVAGSGSKTDYNTGNYTFAGQRHMHLRSTDFDTATTAVPASNTKAGWQVHLGGIYPILGSSDFNNQATASGATLQLSGGPTHSGKWLKRQLTDSIKAAFPLNSRLRNWNLFDNSGYKSYVYVSFYLQSFHDDDPGKWFRMWWRRDLPSTDPQYNSNFWTSKEKNGSFTWSTESSVPGTKHYFHPMPSVVGVWNRMEFLFDFDNDQYRIYVNGKIVTDSTRGAYGPISGALGLNSTLRYALLGNTVDARLEEGHHLGWALPYVDHSPKRIELADSNDWSTKTKSVVQPVKSWNADNVEFILNQGDFADLDNKHIFYLDGATATYIGAL
ncbi:hypothetical protein WJU16_01865 [Chitinophaga pollutisoli]|uniref:Uncharacterized protein n=1 Tax=Chitinophaga pollutisoli TaxID=3133966 RepID=A0ABZ2YR27_9BACT